MYHTRPQFSVALRQTGLWTAVISLYAFYIWGHIPVSNICYALSDQYTPVVYRYYVLLVGKILLTVFIISLLVRLKKGQQGWIKLIAWLLFSGILYLYYADLVKISIEYVHFIQYCLLTVLLCKIFAQHLYIALFLALLAGLVDEAYQAYPAASMNWRDTMLNVTGVIWGGLLYWTILETPDIKP